MAIEKISRHLFETLRGPALKEAGPLNLLVEEYEWYASESRAVSGVLFLDKTDKDYGFAILGRDANGHHRWIDGEHSFSARSEALSQLLSKLSKYDESGQVEFPND